MAGSDAVLDLNKLSVAYDRSPVVRDLTLTVGSGEVVALLGDSALLAASYLGGQAS